MENEVQLENSIRFICHLGTTVNILSGWHQFSSFSPSFYWLCFWLNRHTHLYLCVYYQGDLCIKYFGSLIYWKSHSGPALGIGHTGEAGGVLLQALLFLIIWPGCVNVLHRAQSDDCGRGDGMSYRCTSKWGSSSNWQTSARGQEIVIMETLPTPSGATFRKPRKGEVENRHQCRGMSSFIALNIWLFICTSLQLA